MVKVFHPIKKEMTASKKSASRSDVGADEFSVATSFSLAERVGGVHQTPRSVAIDPKADYSCARVHVEAVHSLSVVRVDSRRDSFPSLIHVLHVTVLWPIALSSHG